MHMSKEFLSTQEFAGKAGISSSTVTKWLRSGKLSGRKEGSKWLISADQLPIQSITAGGSEPVQIPPPEAVWTASPQPGSAYSVEEFSALTYLTAYGVQKWLHEGRLKGELDASGQWRVDAVNLQDPRFQRLIRK